MFIFVLAIVYPSIATRDEHIDLLLGAIGAPFYDANVRNEAEASSLGLALIFALIYIYIYVFAYGICVIYNNSNTTNI